MPVGAGLLVSSLPLAVVPIPPGSPAASLLLPALTLVTWTLFVLVWMYATRLPAMKAARMRPDPNAIRGEQMSTLPASVRWKADNYNHLLEQPTIFYAVIFAAALLAEPGPLDLALAWTYVGLRVVHTFVQTLVNKIEVRFSLFILSTFALMGLTVRTLLAALGS